MPNVLKNFLLVPKHWSFNQNTIIPNYVLFILQLMTSHICHRPAAVPGTAIPWKTMWPGNTNVTPVSVTMELSNAPEYGAEWATVVLPTNKAKQYVTATKYVSLHLQNPASPHLAYLTENVGIWKVVGEWNPHSYLVRVPAGPTKHYWATPVQGWLCYWTEWNWCKVLP